MSEIKKHLVLIADDNADMVMLQVMLMKHKFDIDHVSSVDKIFPAIMDKRYDIIVLDVVFNGSVNYELFDKIAQTPNLPPIIIMSGLPDETIKPIAEKIKASCVMKKPALIQDLIAVISPIIGGLTIPLTAPPGFPEKSE